jgi:hypothetical protein
MEAGAFRYEHEYISSVVPVPDGFDDQVIVMVANPGYQASLRARLWVDETMVWDSGDSQVPAGSAWGRQTAASNDSGGCSLYRIQISSNSGELVPSAGDADAPTAAKLNRFPYLGAGDFRYFLQREEIIPSAEA